MIMIIHFSCRSLNANILEYCQSVYTHTINMIVMSYLKLGSALIEKRTVNHTDMNADISTEKKEWRRIGYECG